MSTLFILIGAEGMGEMNLPNECLPGIRKATDTEEEAFKTALRPLAREQMLDVRDYYIDNTGRPYWLVAVEDNAPEAARTKATNFKRAVRLLD